MRRYCGGAAAAPQYVDTVGRYCGAAPQYVHIVGRYVAQLHSGVLTWTTSTLHCAVALRYRGEVWGEAGNDREFFAQTKKSLEFGASAKKLVVHEKRNIKKKGISCWSSPPSRPSSLDTVQASAEGRAQQTFLVEPFASTHESREIVLTIRPPQGNPIAYPFRNPKTPKSPPPTKKPNCGHGIILSNHSSNHSFMIKNF